MNACRWIIIFVLIVLSGCSSHKVKERHLEADRSAYYPLALVSANSTIIHTGQASDQSDNISVGTHTCGNMLFSGDPGAALVGTLLCLPLITFDLVTAAVDEAKQQKLQAEFEQKIQKLQSRLIKSSNQKILRASAMEYLTEWNADAHEVNLAISPSNATENYHSLQERGFPMALELTLLSVDFSEKKVIRDKKILQFCLTIQTQGRAITTSNSQQVAIEKATGQFCQPFEKWLPDGGIEKAMSNMSSSLTKYIVNEIFLIYHKDKSKDKNAIVIQPITPELVIDKEWYTETHPKRRKDFSTNVTTLRITDVSLKPRFEWEIFDGPDITDVQYELRIYKGKPRVLMTTTMSGNLFKDIVSDEIYPLVKFIFPADLIYVRNNLTKAQHELDISLEPCGWYFWTVRAKFQLSDHPRSTSWARYWGSSFPIRTPASDDDPSCWGQAVDWGAL